MNHEWFIGGKTNITLNMLDRHAASEKKINRLLSGSAKTARQEKFHIRNC
ncbi:MAG: hypothetical protein WKF71_04830 [Pyrinomonadaceae bacterium]